MADLIRDSIRIGIVTSNLIQYLIRMQTADSQVPRLSVRPITELLV